MRSRDSSLEAHPTFSGGWDGAPQEGSRREEAAQEAVSPALGTGQDLWSRRADAHAASRSPGGQSSEPEEPAPLVAFQEEVAIKSPHNVGALLFYIFWQPKQKCAERFPIFNRRILALHLKQASPSR